MARITSYGLPAVILSSVLSTAAFAQLGDQVELSSDSATWAYWLDNDADGDRDLVFVIRLGSSSRIAWRENLGGGTLGPQQTIGEANSWPAIQIADLEGDGDLDVLMPVGNIFGWYVNDGSGQFGAPLVPPSSAFALSAVGADLDGDGDLDYVVADFNRDELHWHENLGGTAFGLRNLIGTTPYLPRNVYAEDFNRDGRVDIAVVGDWLLVGSSTADYGAVYRNTGGGNFVTGASLPESTVNSFYGYSFPDINGDGFVDAVPSGAPFPVWSLNTGLGSFTSPRSLPGGGGRFQDVDGDGDLDLVQTPTSSQPTPVYYEFDNGAFAMQPIALDRSGDGANFRYLLLADVDDDGDDDWVYSFFSPPANLAGVVFEENRFLGSIGSDVCGAGQVNSTGAAAELSASGSILLSNNNGRLAVSGLPLATFGVVLSSMSGGSSPGHMGSEGTLCLGGSGASSLGFGAVIQSGSAGAVAVDLDVTAMPSVNGPVSVAPGETWLFQVWYRDANPAATSNFSSAVAIRFL